MKKILLSFLAIGFTFLAYAQPVSDNATIPMSVTLNSILRLHVTTGGNIEFAINTLEDYTNGITASEGTTTRFTVASSVPWAVEMFAEDHLGGTDLTAYGVGAGVMDIGNIEYYQNYEGSSADGSAYTWSAGTGDGTTAEVLTVDQGAGSNTEIISVAPAGDISVHAFAIAWACATGAASTEGTLLSQGLAADRYSTNVFLILKAE